MTLASRGPRPQSAEAEERVCVSFIAKSEVSIARKECEGSDPKRKEWMATH